MIALRALSAVLFLALVTLVGARLDAAGFRHGGRPFIASGCCTLVTAQCGFSGNNTVSVVTVNYAVNAGNLIVIQSVIHNAIITPTITDSQGNTYTTAISKTVGSNLVNLSYARASATGTDSVTSFFQNTGTNSAGQCGLVYGGAAGVLDGVVAASGNGTSMNSGNVTASQGDDIVVGAGWQEAITGTMSAGAGFTLRSSLAQNQYFMGIEDQQLAAPASLAATMSFTSLNVWVMIGATFY